MTDFTLYVPALEAAGFIVEEFDSEGFFAVSTPDGENYVRHFGEVGWSDDAEALFRSAVLEVAPGSYAVPAMPKHKKLGNVAVLIRDENDKDVLWDRPGQIFADSYPTAWLEALKALHEAGVTW